MPVPDLNSNYFRDLMHGIETHLHGMQRTALDGYFQSRKSAYDAAELSQEEVLQDIAMLIELLHTFSKKNGYQEVKELLEVLGLDRAQLTEGKPDEGDEADDD